jgi:hypothetical protein
MCKTIKHRVKFKAPPATIYDLLADSRKHTAVTGKKANISREIGGAFSASGDDVSGVIVDLVPGQRRYRVLTHRRMPVEPVDISFTANAHACKQVSKQAITTEYRRRYQQRDDAVFKNRRSTLDGFTNAANIR